MSEQKSIIPPFIESIEEVEYRYTDDTLNVLQINLGDICNLRCKHCHVRAGADGNKVMEKSVMEAILKACENHKVDTLDITGGAPELNPHFKWLVEEAAKRCKHVFVRSNLVILTEENFEELIDFFAKNKVEIYGSLPYYRKKEVDRVRGDGVFDASIKALKRLNEIGYGNEDSLILNLIYNPSGAFFAPDQSAMEKIYRKELYDKYGVTFNNLFTIINNPIGRFGDFLEKSGNKESYEKKLYDAFNPATLPGMMCRFQLSVGYDGKLYDCDFNQAIDLAISTGETIFDIMDKPYQKREIAFGNHCYACTAGAGSSCGGATS